MERITVGSRMSGNPFQALVDLGEHPIGKFWREVAQAHSTRTLLGLFAKLVEGNLRSMSARPVEPLTE